MTAEREIDLLVYGATGVTGRQAAAYLAKHAPPGLRLAVAGRSAERLAEVARSLGREVRVIVADAKDGPALDALARQCRVVLTTAGPYAKYGDELVRACVEARTDYLDITGETPWVRSVIDRHHEKAASQGTRIVPCCGFDSVPSDLGVFVVARHLRELGQGTARVQSAFTAKGGFNGGTLDSAVTLAETGQTRQMGDTLLLNPPTHRSDEERRRSRDRRAVEWSDAFGKWLAPFFMAPVNTRVVRRSNALLAMAGAGYGERFAYEESLETRSRVGANLMAGSIALGFRVLGTSVGRSLVRRFGPKPGEGPSEAVREGGFFRARFRAEADDGRVVWAEFSDRGDPGNKATVKMLCEGGLLLATTPRDALPGGAALGGVLTPATALGAPYVDRLRAAGMSIRVPAT